MEIENLEENTILEKEYEGNLSPFSEVAHDFRLTFSGQSKDLKELEDKTFINMCTQRAQFFVKRCIESSYFTKCTGAIEMLDKRGENCSLHFHLRFYSNKVTQSLRKTFKRWLEEDYDQDTRGNKNFMFKATVVRDKNHFFEYLLKQNLNNKLCYGFAQQQLEEMHRVAKASYYKVVQVNQQKMDNRDNSDTLFQRVMLKLKKTTNLKTRDIARIFIETYVEEERPINHTTIQGYVTNASLKLGIMSIDELMDKWGY